jgi:glycosyltransferase involved in cell wall biosynthesis
MPAERILILTNRVPYPLNDGGNLAVQAMIEGYQKAGWEVYLLSMLTTRHPVAEEKLAELFPDIYKFETVKVNNNVRPIPTVLNYVLSRKPNHLLRFKSKVFERKLRTVIKDFQPKVIQMESPFLAQYLDIIKEESKALNVLRMHNIEYQVWERLADEVKNPLKKHYLANLAKRIKKFEIEAWKRFDLLLPITKDDAAIVRFLYHYANMAVAPFSIDTASITTGVNERWVGYHIGAMDWIPNIEAIKWFLYLVWPDVQRAVPGFEFYFAGRNMPEMFFGNIPEGTFCKGEVEDASAFIADKKILIVPLRSGGGIRVKILEAMAAGKLVISTTVGMQGIEAVNGVHYLAANSSRQFAEAISKAFADRGASERICENAVKLINEKYRKDSVMKVVLEAIETSYNSIQAM